MNVKISICDIFNIVSTTVNGKITAEYRTFEEKLKYFYQQGGTDTYFINCIYQISNSLALDMFNYVKNNVDRFNDKIDNFGFSALYYLKLRPTSKSDISTLEKLGFREIYPTSYKVRHFEKFSEYFHEKDTGKTAVVFLGNDTTGAVDINAVHTLFIKGYDVISIDARENNIELNEVYSIISQYYQKDISLFYVASHGTESTLRHNMHTIPILGCSEKVTEHLYDKTVVYYTDNVINTATFARGLSYAAKGHYGWVANLLTKLPYFFHTGKEIDLFLASCNGQLARYDLKYSLPKNSQVLILGENQFINGVKYIKHVTDRNEIDLLDMIVSNDTLNTADLKSIMNAYTKSIVEHGTASPYYMKIVGHKLWGSPITKEFSCLTVLEEKTEELLKLREEKDNRYSELLTYACNYGYEMEDPILENMMTKEMVKNITIMAYNYTKPIIEEIYKVMSYVGDSLYEGIKHYGNETINYMSGGKHDENDL